MNMSVRYRLKALTIEQLAHDTTDPAVKAAWIEIAIEWHALSNRAAQVADDGYRTIPALSDASLQN
jgi:hypothetical protein